MAHDPHRASAETPGTGDDSPSGSSARRGPEVDGGDVGSGGAGSTAAASSPRRQRSSLPIIAAQEQLRIGDVDLAAARGVLAEIGADGSAPLDDLGPAETIALLAGLRELSGAIAAVEARALVRLEAAVKEDSVRRGETPEQALRVARSEASKALKQSTSCAGRSMASCGRLVRSMPGMLTALALGKVVPTSAHRVARILGPARPEQRSEVDEILTAHLPHLVDCGPEEWGSEAAKVLHGLDPRGAAERHRVARQERHVTVRRAEHGMCSITALVAGLDGARIRKGLSLAAESARAQGDRRGHQQIMADLFTDALIGRGEGVDPSTLEIGVIITDRSLFAPAHADAALIEGFGPVPFEHVRQEMGEAMASAADDPELAMTLRRLYTDPDDGQLVAAESTSRAFPPSLARFLRLAHQTCRAPHCDASIRQNDHIVPWSQGGPTSLDNGNGLCAADNQKEKAGESARVLHDENGIRRTVEWTSRYGQRARRRGINLDPLGTGRRLLDRAARSTDRAARSADRAGRSTPPPTGPPTAPSNGEQTPDAHGTAPGPAGPGRARPPDVPAEDPADSWFLRDFDRMERRFLDGGDPHPSFRPPGHSRRRLLRGRTDHIFGPHLTVITDRPWRGS